LPSIIKVDQIQSDTGNVNIASAVNAIGLGKSLNTNWAAAGSTDLTGRVEFGSGSFFGSISANKANGNLNTAVNAYHDGTNWRYVNTGSYPININMAQSTGNWITAFADPGTAGGTVTFTNSVIINKYGIGVGGTVPTSGAGIAFNVSQSASSDPNTLDDYEEGSFSPILKLGTTTQTQTSGGPNAIYTKIGKLVFFSIETYFTKSGTGDFSVSSLPFTTAANRQCNVSWYFQFYTSSMPSSDHLTYIESSGTAFTPQYMPSGGTQTLAINDTHFTGSTNYFYCSGTYMAAS